MPYARTFAWEISRRHRVGFAVIAAYIAVLASFRLITHTPGNIDSLRFAFTVIVPLTAAALYILGVFSFGLSGDLAVRESLYPTRLFTLPVKTAALVDWPMLYGMLCVVALYLATALLALRPAGVHVALIWPCVFGAAFLGWAQALVWMPYGLRGVRVVLASAWLVTVDTVVLLAIHFKAPQSLMLMLLTPQVPLAYVTARYAVAAARSGQVPDWSLTRRAQVTAAAVRRRNFDSPARAQFWVEWREHGRALLALVAMIVPFELALLFVGSDSPDMTMITLEVVLLTPPVLAACTAATMQQGLTGFMATRPLTDAQLVGAKLKVAALSTLLTWVCVLIALPLALIASGNMPAVIAEIHRLERFMGPARAIVMIVMMFAVVILMTWRQLVQSLYVSLSGRAWLSRANVTVIIAIVVLSIPVGDTVLHRPDIIATIWRNLRWILAAFVFMKLTAAMWTVTKIHRRGVPSERGLLIGALLWSAAVLALQGVYMWILNVPQIPTFFITMIAIIVMPLARVSGAMLALNGGRHA